MDASRRAFLLALLDDEQAAPRDRLKATELLDRLDERQTQAATPQAREDELIEHLSQPERLGQVIEAAIALGMFDQFPAFREHVEQRAEALIAERATERRAEFALVDRGAEKPPAAPDPPGPGEGLRRGGPVRSGPERTPEVHPLDEAALRMLADDEEPERPSLRPRPPGEERRREPGARHFEPGSRP
jgi:hypothetical protein